MLKILVRLSTAWLVIINLVSCSDSSPGGGGIGGTGRTQIVTAQGVVVGPVDGFGSIIVSGRRFNTDTADVTINGEPAQLLDLHVGMKVSARVQIDSLIASRIQYQPDVIGVIETISDDGKVLSLVGQLVQLTPDTVFHDISVDDLAVGMVVEVSGNRNSDNVIVATYLSGAPIPEAYFAIGLVGAVLNETPDTVVLSGTLIDYMEFRQSLGLSASMFESIYLSPGTIIRSNIIVAQGGEGGQGGAGASGAPDGEDGEDGINGYLVVSGLDVIEQLELNRGEEIEINSVVSEVVFGGGMIVNGVSVSVDSETIGVTRFGVNLSEFTAVKNERVLLQGRGADDGNITAQHIVFLDRE